MNSGFFSIWLTYFYFYCVFGWIFESTYVSICQRRMINRGFMHGPWLPLYGSGAILILLITLPVKQWPILVYFVGAIGATILEFFTGEAMVRLFKVRYWDYSYRKIQYKGHICLHSTIAWGFLSLFMVYFLHNYVIKVVNAIPTDIISILTFLITIGMAYDFSVALRKAIDLRDLIIQSEKIKEELEEHAYQIKEELEEHIDQIKEELEEHRELLKEKIERKQRLREATGTFVRAAIERSWDEKKEAFEESWDERKTHLEALLEDVNELMANRAEHLLIHNPGSSFISVYGDDKLVREKISQRRKMRKKS